MFAFLFTFVQYTIGLSLVESMSHWWKTDEFNNSLGDISWCIKQQFGSSVSFTDE